MDIKADTAQIYNLKHCDLPVSEQINESGGCVTAAEDCLTRFLKSRDFAEISTALNFLDQAHKKNQKAKIELANIPTQILEMIRSGKEVINE